MFTFEADGVNDAGASTTQGPSSRCPSQAGRVRESTPGVPVLLVTASPASAIAAACPRERLDGPAGGRPDGVLVKPFRAEQLLSAALRLAGGRSLRARWADCGQSAASERRFPCRVLVLTLKS